MSIGELLHQKRKEKNLSLEKVAEQCGVSQRYINSLEENNTDAHAEGVLYKMANLTVLQAEFVGYRALGFDEKVIFVKKLDGVIYSFLEALSK